MNGAITSTTGNNTGMMIDTTCYEWVAGYGYAVSGPDARYYNQYGSEAAGGKIGDAIITCANWHSATQKYWVSTYNAGANTFIRGYSGIFSYHGCASKGDNHGVLSQTNGKPSSWVGSNWNAFGRGVAVCGQGL